MTKRMVLIAIAAATALNVSACTKSDSGIDNAAQESPSTSTMATSTTATAATSTSQGSASGDTAAKDQFLVDGNAVCAAMDAEAAAQSQEIAPNGAESKEQVVAVVEGKIGIVEKSLAALRALPQPPGDEDRLEAMYQAVAGLNDIAADVVDAINQNDQQAYTQAANTLDTETAQVNAQFDDYGLTVCGTNATEDPSSGGAAP